MAYFTEHDRQRINETVARWKDVCLLDEGSLIFDDRTGVWSESNVADLRSRFNENQLAGEAGGGTFWMSPGSVDIQKARGFGPPVVARSRR